MLKQMTAYKDLCKIQKESVFGETINAGSQTVVVLPKEKILDNIDIKTPVLILTKENEKKNFLKQLFKDSEVFIEDLNYETMNEEFISDFIELEQNGWNMFFSTKMNEFDILWHSSIGLALSNLTDLYINKKYTSSNINVLELDMELIDQLENEYSLEEDENFLITKEDLKIVNAVNESLKVISEIDMDSDFTIDLHTKQFLELNGELYCTDPILFNYNDIEM